MKVSGEPRGRVWWRVAVAVAAWVLTACGTTGQSFNSVALSEIIPGQTTFMQAQALLEAAPVDIYQQGDGSTLARWAHKSSMVADAIYVRQELSLLFDAYGRFERVVDSVNVLGRPGKPPQGEPVRVAQFHTTRAGGDKPPNPLADASAKGIENPVVTYPLAAP